MIVSIYAIMINDIKIKKFDLITIDDKETTMRKKKKKKKTKKKKKKKKRRSIKKKKKRKREKIKKNENFVHVLKKQIHDNATISHFDYWNYYFKNE